MAKNIQMLAQTRSAGKLNGSASKQSSAADKSSVKKEKLSKADKSLQKGWSYTYKNRENRLD